MRSFVIVSFLILNFKIVAQNTLGSADDAQRIAISSYLSPQIENFPKEASNLLLTKLDKIVTQNGMGGSRNSSRFIITANVVVLNKEITPSAPPQHMYNLEVTYYIGDAIDGIKFATTSATYSGIAPSETKAYIAALSQIKPTDKTFNKFIEEGKNRIIEYYNTQCDFILKSAQASASQNNYDEAIYQLTQVPDVCKSCFEKCMNAVAPLVQKQLDRDCISKLNQANVLWNANMDVFTANQVSEILTTIDPQANCFNDVKKLSEKIETRVKELDKREWKMALKIQQDEVDIQKARIKAARDIGVAYGNNQPKVITTYNIRGWW